MYFWYQINQFETGNKSFRCLATECIMSHVRSWLSVLLQKKIDLPLINGQVLCLIKPLIICASFISGSRVSSHLCVYDGRRVNNPYNFYRPQRSWGKAIFSVACQEFCPGGSATTPQGDPPGKETPLARRPPPPGKETPLSPWQGRPPLPRRPPCQGDTPMAREIWATSGQYTSYCNIQCSRLVLLAQVLGTHGLG